jgi:hypothetical protein
MYRQAFAPSDGRFVLILLQDYDLALRLPIGVFADTRIDVVNG